MVTSDPLYVQSIWSLPIMLPVAMSAVWICDHDDVPLAVRRSTPADAPGVDAPIPTFASIASTMSLRFEIWLCSSKPGSFLSVVAVGFARASKDAGKFAGTAHTPQMALSQRPTSQPE